MYLALEEQHELEELIKIELSLYDAYQQILIEERTFVRASLSEKILEKSSEREILTAQIKLAHEVRRKFMRRFSADRLITLTNFVKQFIAPAEQVPLMKLVKQLREKVAKTQSSANEFSQVVGFSLRMVGGLVSILWSATQNVVRCYTMTGAMHEAFHPVGGRTAGILMSV